MPNYMVTLYEVDVATGDVIAIATPDALIVARDPQAAIDAAVADSRTKRSMSYGAAVEVLTDSGT